MKLNTIILIGPCLIAIFYPHIGKISSILGGIGSFLAIYTLPTVTHITQKHALVDDPYIYSNLSPENATEDICLSPTTSSQKRLNPSYTTTKATNSEAGEGSGIQAATPIEERKK